jgi:hypothetical protein
MSVPAPSPAPAPTVVVVGSYVQALILRCPAFPTARELAAFLKTQK